MIFSRSVVTRVRATIMTMVILVVFAGAAYYITLRLPLTSTPTLMPTPTSYSNPNLNPVTNTNSNRMLSTTQEMFMLLFSILYGIMLNSLMNLGAFPIAHAWAGEYVISRDACDKPLYDKGKISLYRLILSIGLFNIFPFVYFAFAFLNINLIGDIISTDIISILKIILIGFLSLGVFAFPQFFFCAITSRWGNRFYSQDDLERIINKRAIHRCSLQHLLAGFTYFLIPLLLFLLLKALNIL